MLLLTLKCTFFVDIVRSLFISGFVNTVVISIYFINSLYNNVKNRLSSNEYYQLYPTGSCTEKFYGIAKIHKVPLNGFIDNLPLRPIISNIDTASYQQAKYLAKLLSPLAQSNFTINSTKDLMIKIKNENIPENYEIVSFDLTYPFFTSVPLEHTIEIIIK